MRRIIALVAIAATVAGCGGLKKTFGIKDAPPAHSEPNTTSIYGNWVLTNLDSTAFAGAKLVELELQPTTFTLTARYPSQKTVAVTGTVGYGDGLLTLTPISNSASIGERLHGAFVAGKPIVVVASAAGGSLVFAPPPTSLQGSFAVVPTSVWNKRSQAERAGQVPGSR
jgi:hypothetical protein